MAAADEPFSVAVTVAAWFETSVPVLAVNVAEVALAATLTEDGTVNTSWRRCWRARPQCCWWWISTE